MAIKVLDLNNFWSPTGGGVRRYHLEKLEYYKTCDEVDYTFGMGDSYNSTEEFNPLTRIAHYSAFKFPGNWSYRYALRTSVLKKLILKYQPDVIEIGSPYIMPWKVFKAIEGMEKKPKIVGFWHADFPVTYVGRFFSQFNRELGRFAESKAWKYARNAFNKMDGVFVSSEVIQQRMNTQGINNTLFLPLGVDTVKFNPEFKSETLKEKYPDFDSKLSIFYPHRFSEEKGVRSLIKAIEILDKKGVPLPLLFFAGTGPDLDKVEELCSKHPSIHYLGFIKDPKEMAAFYATCDMTLALSGWETFGLSILEAMSSGLSMIGANTGAASEHIQKSEAGWTIPTSSPKELAAKLEEIITDRSLLEGKDKKAREYAESLSWTHCFDKQVELYKDLVK